MVDRRESSVNRVTGRNEVPECMSIGLPSPELWVQNPKLLSQNVAYSPLISEGSVNIQEQSHRMRVVLDIAITIVTNLNAAVNAKP